MRNSLCSTEVATSKLQTQSLWKRYKYEGVNGGWQTSDKGRKILLTTDTTRKKLPTTEKGRHYLFVFRKKSILYFFSTCLRSKRRYHQLINFIEETKVKNRTFLVSMDVTSLKTNIPPNESIDRSVQSEWKFLQSNPLIPTHYPQAMCEGSISNFNKTLDRQRLPTQFERKNAIRNK